MKAIKINEFVKSYDEIKVSEVPSPQPKDDEVLVQIEAAGVNFVDLLYAGGKGILRHKFLLESCSANSTSLIVFTPPKQPLTLPKSRGKHQNNRSLILPPFALGLEFAGTILSSPSSSQFKPGDRIYGGCLGSYAQQIALKPSLLHRIPSSWDFASAAGFAATAPVSYGALITRGKLEAGETVLIHAAAGGLGLMAVQIAKAVGCKVVATAGSDAKLEIAKRFGADHGVNYTNQDWYKEVLDLTKGMGVDVVYDPVGLVDKSLKCLKHKGRILVVGFAGSEGELEKIAMNRVLLKQAQLIGYRFGETERRDPAENVEVWKGLNAMIEKSLIKPAVFDKEYIGLERVVTAMQDLSDRKVWGKAVITIEHNEKPRL